MLIAFLEVDAEPGLRVLIIHIVLHVKVDAAQSIDELRKGLEIDHDILVDGYAEQSIDLATVMGAPPSV